MDATHDIKLNFSNHHDNYYSAYRYVVKEDTEFVLSQDHPDETGPPRTTSATRKRRSDGGKLPKQNKRQRLSVFDVFEMIQSRNI